MLRFGSLTLESPLLLAPIAGYCDLAFRLVVRSVRGEHGGVGLACTDLLCPQAILNQSTKMMWLAATSPEDRPLCMQIYGRAPAIMAEAARWAVEHGAAVVDINMGCPVDKVTKKNGGARLLCEPALAAEIVRGVVKVVVGTPVTAKIRLGWDEDNLVAQTLPRMLADAGIAGLTVHGRTAAQRFSGAVSLAGIARVVEALAESHPELPVIGNGDIRTPQDARTMMEQTGCAGVMIGRAALGQPWIFRDTAQYLATGMLPPPLTRTERARLVLEHFENLLRLRGQRVALAVIRQRMSGYSPHLQPWPNLKRDVQGVTSAEEFRAFMARGASLDLGEQLQFDGSAEG